MTGKPVIKGAIYHHSSHRRREVQITPTLRRQVIETTEAIRRMLQSGRPPPPTDDRSRCRGCSLYDLCQPELIAADTRLRTLRKRLFIPEDGL
jgi:CRISPR-associated exonuclease Cas4